ncbi:hypothetical protein V8C86DRAFT_3024380, partial [Haematococcus lacustris]
MSASIELPVSALLAPILQRLSGEQACEAADEAALIIRARHLCLADLGELLQGVARVCIDHSVTDCKHAAVRVLLDCTHHGSNAAEDLASYEGFVPVLASMASAPDAMAPGPMPLAAVDSPWSSNSGQAPIAPTALMTRESAAVSATTLLWRLAAALPAQDHMLEQLPTLPDVLLGLLQHPDLAVRVAASGGLWELAQTQPTITHLLHRSPDLVAQQLAVLGGPSTSAASPPPSPPRLQQATDGREQQELLLQVHAAGLLMLLATDPHHAASIAASLPRVLHCLVSPHSATLVFTTKMALRHGCGQLLEVLLQHDSPSLLLSASSALLLMASELSEEAALLLTSNAAFKRALTRLLARAVEEVAWQRQQALEQQQQQQQQQQQGSRGAGDEAVQGGVLDSADMAASQAVLEASQAALHTLMAAVQSEGCARALAAQDCGLLAHLQLLVQAVAAGALARFAAYLGLRQHPTLASALNPSHAQLAALAAGLLLGGPVVGSPTKAMTPSSSQVPGLAPAAAPTLSPHSQVPPGGMQGAGDEGGQWRPAYLASLLAAVALHGPCSPSALDQVLVQTRGALGAIIALLPKAVAQAPAPPPSAAPSASSRMGPWGRVSTQGQAVPGSSSSSSSSSHPGLSGSGPLPALALTATRRLHPPSPLSVQLPDSWLDEYQQALDLLAVPRLKPSAPHLLAGPAGATAALQLSRLAACSPDVARVLASKTCLVQHTTALLTGPTSGDGLWRYSGLTEPEWRTHLQHLALQLLASLVTHLPPATLDKEVSLTHTQADDLMACLMELGLLGTGSEPASAVSSA